MCSGASVDLPAGVEALRQGDEGADGRGSRGDDQDAPEAELPHAASEHGVSGVATPVQYGSGKDALFRNSRRAREELMELRRKAKPARHAPASLPQAAE